MLVFLVAIAVFFPDPVLSLKPAPALAELKRKVSVQITPPANSNPPHPRLPPAKPPSSVANGQWYFLMNGATGLMTLHEGGTLYYPTYSGSISFDASLPLFPSVCITNATSLSSVHWSQPVGSTWVLNFYFTIQSTSATAYTVQAGLILGQVTGYYDLNGWISVGSTYYPFNAAAASSSLTYYPAPNFTTAILSNGWAGGLDLDLTSGTSNLYMDTVALPTYSYTESNEQATNEVQKLASNLQVNYFTWSRSNGQKYIALVSQSGFSAYGQFTDVNWPDPNFPKLLAGWTFQLTLGDGITTGGADLSCVLYGDYTLLYGNNVLLLSLSYQAYYINPFPNPPPFVPCPSNPTTFSRPSGGWVQGVLSYGSGGNSESVAVQISNRHWGWYIYFTSKTVSPGNYVAMFDNYQYPHGLHGNVVAGGVSYPLQGVGPL